jgi:hypothetical protein
VKNRFQSLPFKCDLQRYTEGWIQVSSPVDGPPEVREKKKAGLVSIRPGDYLLLELDASTAGAGDVLGGGGAAAAAEKDDDQEKEKANGKDDDNPPVVVETVVEVEIFYLISYQHMGAARVTCEGGCKCAPQLLDGVNRHANTSVTHGRTFELAGSGDMAHCRVALTNVDAPVVGSMSSEAGDHKFKLLSIHMGAKVKLP